jgi:hypothetical protein
VKLAVGDTGCHRAGMGTAARCGAWNCAGLERVGLQACPGSSSSRGHGEVGGQGVGEHRWGHGRAATGLRCWKAVLRGTMQCRRPGAKGGDRGRRGCVEGCGAGRQ